MKILPMKRCPGPDGLIAELCQVSQELTSTLLKLVLETERETALPNSFDEASVTLIPKPDKDTTNTKPNFSDKHRHQNSQQTIFKLHSMKHKSINHDQISFILGIQRWYMQT